MFVIALIVLIGSVISMAVITILKIPALRELKVSDKVERVSLPVIVKKSSQSIVNISTDLAKRSSIRINKSAKKLEQKEKPKFSDDYWEKVKKG